MPIQCRATQPVLSTISLSKRGARQLTTGGGVSQTSQPLVSRPSLSRLRTGLLLRSIVLTSLMSRSWILRPCLAFLAVSTNSKLAILNPDRNPVLNQLLRWSIYDHFCAGTNHREVSRSVAEIKQMGYQGVILGYSKEIVLDPDVAISSSEAEYGPNCYEMIERWKRGTLETLSMIGPGDFLAVKLTGAGPISVDAMRAKKPIPKAVEEAVDEICEKSREQGSRVWFDAEQQVLQPGLDEWAIEIMRRHNQEGKALVYNTIQSYLKGSEANAGRHITLAAQEGWTLAIKLVRGAYIDHEARSLIHNTKEDTDRCYDLIADMLISQRLPRDADYSLQFPSSALFLATHNAASADRAISTHRQRFANGLPTTVLECGQVVGMADELSCDLLQNYEQCIGDSSMDKTKVPRVFKCLTWGSVAECMGYLWRRAIENRGAVDRTQHMAAALKQELRRRVFG